MGVGQPLDPVRELLEAFEHSCLVTEYLVDALPSRVWRLEPPYGRGRTIAAMVTHLQSVRRTFAKMGGARPIPPRLDRDRSAPDEARRALGQSREGLMRLFRQAFSQNRARVTGMPRRAVNMMAYLMQHDAHHRGQICVLAKVLGHRLSKDDIMRIWGWKRLPDPGRTLGQRRVSKARRNQ